MRRWPFSLATIALVACTSVSLSGGASAEVVLLDGGFVRFEGQRIATEAFLLEIRQRIRDASGDSTRYPALRILIEADLPSGRLDKLIRELQSAGVRHVTLG